ncbi:MULTISPECIES: TIGR02186 family protein [Falsihalocynthiibacter]|uniref:TIGR02186 family protein n=1 Tax=Falsihalocynthiibacter TaxID=2854182 RepID=UPI0030035BCD
MRSLLLATILLLTSVVTAPAREEVIAALSHNNVAITANFDGSEILIFGAIKRDSPIPEGEELDIIITVSGPSLPVLVRRKSRVLGIWVNTDAVEVDAAPSFYAVATTSPLQDILSQTSDLRHDITINNAVRSVGAPSNITDSETFTEALIRIRDKEKLYQLLEGAVELSSDTLFRTSIALPANLTEGTYKTRFLLVRNGRVVNQTEASIEVRKVGVERWLYNLAHQHSLIYGIMSLFIAIFAGWGASAIFRYFRA